MNKTKGRRVGYRRPAANVNNTPAPRKSGQDVDVAGGPFHIKGKLLPCLFGLAGIGAAWAFVGLVKSMNKRSEKRTSGKVDMALEKTKAECHIQKGNAATDNDIRKDEAVTDHEIKKKSAETDNNIRQAQALSNIKIEEKAAIEVIKHAVKQSESVNPITPTLADVEEADSWNERFDKKHQLPFNLPPIIGTFYGEAPEGLENAMFFHLFAMMGTVVSKVRARYLDGQLKAPNVLAIAEGMSGTGKGHLANVYRSLFGRIKERDDEKIKSLGKGKIILTIPADTSQSALFNIQKQNQQVHCFMFSEELPSVIDAAKTGRGIRFDSYCKAFDNGEIGRVSLSKSTESGQTKLFMNVSLTGVPSHVEKLMAGQASSGVPARFFNSGMDLADPDATVPNYPDEVNEPWRDLIDGLIEKYCFTTDPETGEDKAVDEVVISLDYVNKALKDWLSHQNKLARKEKNPARTMNCRRAAAAAFQIALIAHVLYGEETEATRGNVEQIAIYAADYNIERYLWQYGEEYNKEYLRVKTKEAYGAHFNPTKGKRIEIPADVQMEMFRLHTIPNEAGETLGRKKICSLFKQRPDLGWLTNDRVRTVLKKMEDKFQAGELTFTD